MALAPIDLDIGPGGVTGLLGPNGSGKSTLLRSLIGLVRPDAGSARVDGIPLVGDGTEIRRRCTYAPGEVHLYGEMRGSEHLDWFMRGRDRASRDRSRELGAALGLPLEQRVSTYSHGMKRQLLFAAAMAPAVSLRILDEPTEGLDPSKRATVIELLREDTQAGTTVFLSSHHLGEVDRVCDRMLFMNAGKLVADETSETVRKRQRRVMHLEFAESAAAGLAEALQRIELPAKRVGVEGTRVIAILADDDPRAFLAALGHTSTLPAPLSIEYGRLSLEDLYRDLYGVEGF